MSDYRHEVSRRIAASPGTIFSVLADPALHTELDGSGMLRGAVTCSPLTGVGDEFTLNMYFSELGNYQMVNRVVAFEPDRRIVWEPREPDEAAWGHQWGYELAPDGPGATIVTEIFDCARWPDKERTEMEDGRIWIKPMTKTLERLDQLCAAK